MLKRKAKQDEKSLEARVDALERGLANALSELRSRHGHFNETAAHLDDTLTDLNHILGSLNNPIQQLDSNAYRKRVLTNVGQLSLDSRRSATWGDEE